MSMQPIARWLGGAKKVAPLLALLAAGLAAVAALGLAASAASAATFSNNDGITFNDGVNCDPVTDVSLAPGSATPYPSEIAVSRLDSSVSDVNVTVSGLGHEFPADIGLLLVSPAGKSVILMTDIGRDIEVSGINLTFDDAASGAVPNDGPLTSGTYRPGRGTYNNGCLAPASFPAWAPASPYGSSMSVFNNTNPNGDWKLYVIDDTQLELGSISGWSLEITTTNTTAPKVISTFPGDGQEVGPAANIRATFSEEMREASVKNAFKLFKKGSTTQTAAVVSYDT
jgi:subtilisin-like proprotein convertase family protein